MEEEGEVVNNRRWKDVAAVASSADARFVQNIELLRHLDQSHEVIRFFGYMNKSRSE